MQIKTVLYPTIVLLVVALFGCPGPKKGNLKFTEVDLPAPDTTTAVNDNQLAAENVTGYAAKYWGKLLKNCMQSLLLKKKDADYLGPSNTIGLGTVVSGDLSGTFRLVDSTTFSKEELAKIIKTGDPTSCESDISSSLDLKALLTASINVKNDDDLNIAIGGAINRNKKVNFTVDNWRKDELILGPLNDALADESDLKKKAFKADLNKPGRLIMNRVVRVKGFTADIELKNSITPQVIAKIGKGVVGNVGSSADSVSISVVGDKTIRLKSTGDFFIYGKFMKAEELQ